MDHEFLHALRAQLCALGRQQDEESRQRRPSKPSKAQIQVRYSLIQILYMFRADFPLHRTLQIVPLCHATSIPRVVQRIPGNCLSFSFQVKQFQLQNLKELINMFYTIQATIYDCYKTVYNLRIGQNCTITAPSLHVRCGCDL